MNGTNRPRAYDLKDPEEVRRLLREVRGYLRVSVNHGTDREGREHALGGLSELIALIESQGKTLGA